MEQSPPGVFSETTGWDERLPGNHVCSSKASLIDKVNQIDGLSLQRIYTAAFPKVLLPPPMQIGKTICNWCEVTLQVCNMPDMKQSKTVIL